MHTWGVQHVWASVTIFLSYIFFKLLRFGRREKFLPPGPPTIPILGNAHLLIGKNIYKRFKHWSDQYGAVFSLKVGKGTVVVLNSKRAIYELVDKKSAMYMHRPSEEQVLNTLKGENFGLLDAGPIWRAHRKIVSRLFTPSKLDDDMAKISEAEIVTLMYDLLVSPDDFSSHIKRCTASAAAIIVFGQRAVTHDSFWATGVYTAMDALKVATNPGTYPPTEQFPILKYLPVNPAKARAEESYRIMTGIWVESKERVERRRSQGDIRDSLLDQLLGGQIKPEVPFQGTQLAHLAGTVMEGSSDTTSIAMHTNILFLATHPNVQDKARAELDAVCGSDRPPTWSDFKALPYINCILKEGQRIRPVFPMGVPHRCTEDNWYEGMLIPKDATIIIPTWAIHHTEYVDPDTYNPDRFLKHTRLAMDYAGSGDYQNRDHYAYGAGRRICVGIHFAERTQWRILAKILWGFTIEHAVDDNGEQITLDHDGYSDAMISDPLPFIVKITPRSEKHADIIKRNYENVKEFLKKWE